MVPFTAFPQRKRAVRMAGMSFMDPPELSVIGAGIFMRNGVNRSFQSTTLKALSVRGLLSIKVRPREMILGPIIPEQGLTMIHAPRGIGKTHVSLMIAYTLATGDHMFQERWVCSKPNKVLFIELLRTGFK